MDKQKLKNIIKSSLIWPFIRRPYKSLNILLDNFRQRKEYYEQKKHYDIICNNLREKIENTKKIKVAFFVIFDSVFPAKSVFEKMLDNDIFDPTIIIIPDVSRGNENMHYQLKKSYQTYLTLYGNDRIILSYDKEIDNFVDYSSQFDIICFCNPYDNMTHLFFQMNYLKTKNVLTFYLEYATVGIVNYTANHVVNLPIMNLFWIIFTQFIHSFIVYQKNKISKTKNLIITGTYLFDKYKNINKTHSKRKCIIIAPHHTIGIEFNGILKLSNFMEYADLFLELPRLYSDIDFVFRPHPLLIPRLKEYDQWGNEKTEKWLGKFLENKNTCYSEGGDYVVLFNNSDGLIHDCGSFLLDYLFTRNPCCYMLHKNKNLNIEFTNFGIQCLDQYYLAYEEKDIINFIDNVITRKNDPLKSEREVFYTRYLHQNYNTSENIIKNITETIMHDKN
jgi:hypothetical protein